jgi:hypothetical protein
VSVTYLLSYISTNKIVDRQVGLTGLVLAAALGVAMTIAWGPLPEPGRPGATVKRTKSMR